MAYAKLLEHGDPDYFYTVEYRTWDGYDGLGGVPGEAVVLHQVRTWLADRWAQVVDPDGDGDCNDEAAMWLPGETYLNGADAVIAHVEWWDGERAVVAVSNQARNPVYVDGSYAGAEYGTPPMPWNTVEEGYASVYAGGTVFIEPGSYSEGLNISKPCVLLRGGSSGSVIIGE
jgi:hypothetical protein